jgi:hypothetical protein
LFNYFPKAKNGPAQRAEPNIEEVLNVARGPKDAGEKRF